MARWRGIDTDIWQNPSFRKLSDRAQKVFIYLITTADDEGRVALDAEAILEGAWRRSANIKPHQVEEALAEVTASPLICVYAGAGVTLAFLRGWFEHQPEQNTARDESTLPPPPLDDVISWRGAKAIKAEYCAETGTSAQGTYLRNALAWHRGKKSQSTESQVAVESDSSKRRVEESRGLASPSLPVSPGPSDPPIPPETPRPVPPAGVTPPARLKLDVPEADKPSPKKETVQQAAIREAWEAFGFGELPKPNPKYSAVTKIVGDNGAPKIKAFAAYVREHPEELPEGANAWDWFCNQLRRGMNRDFKWDPAEQAVPKKKPGGYMPAETDHPEGYEEKW